MRYERVVAEIDLGAIGNNIGEIRKTVGSSKIMAIVKADGYGHGAEQVSKKAFECGADSFGVAIIEEGIALRENGLTTQIVILGVNPHHRIDEAVRFDLAQTVFTYKQAEEISSEAAKQNKIAAVHIKVDTGMGRIGFIPSKPAADDIAAIASLPNISIDGIYTHFSTADEADKSYTYEQNERFTRFLDLLKSKGIRVGSVHTSNSAAIVDMEQFNYDVVRAGIIMYGLYPSLDVNTVKLSLKPAMSLKSSVSYVKTIEPGDTVGYGAAFRAERKTTIATIPVGYADGYSRSLSGKGRVLINGDYAPIAGRVCMDQFMVDVTDIANVNIGDEVVMFGRQNSKEITAYEIAGLCDTITHDVVCMIGKRVPRTYLDNVK